MSHRKDLARKYPPSEPCTCAVCVGYCARPGWWTVPEASRALESGYALRMMLELSPERSFGVLSPAFFGCGGTFAIQEFAHLGCNFLKQERCELHGTGFQPLECRVCHHARPGLGARCHADIEKSWDSPAGRLLVREWCQLSGVWDLLDRYGLDKLKAV